MRFGLIRLIGLMSLSVFIAALFLAGCARKDRPVAKVGDVVITADEFREGFVAKYLTQENAEKQSFKERKEFLEQLVERKLMVAAAYNMGLDKKEEATEAGDKSQEITAVNELLYQREIIDKVINEEMMQEYYSNLGEEIHARHILIGTDPADSTSDSTAMVKCDSIYNVLQEGGNFEEMARLFSEDRSNSGKGGDLGFFKWGRMVQEFQEAAFALKPGEISPPVKTQFGFHLIELVDRRPDTTLKSYDEEIPRITADLKLQKSAQLRELADNYLTELKEGYGLEYFDDSLTVVFGKIGDPATPTNNSLFADFTEEERKMVVAKWDSGEVTVADLDEKIGAGSRARSMLKEAADFHDVIDGILLPKLLAKRARAIGLYDDPKALKSRKTAMENIMQREIERLEVDDKLNFDDESLRAFYEKNKHKYMTDPQVSIREIYISDKKKAEELLMMGKQGKDWKFLCEKYTERQEAQDKGGLLGPFDRYRYGQVGREAHKLQEGQFNKAPLRVGNKYSIFRVEEKISARQKAFDEARAEIDRDYRRDARKEVRQSWLASLRDDIPVKIDEKALRAVIPFEKVEAPKTEKKEEPKKPERKVTLQKTEPAPQKAEKKDKDSK